MDDLISRKELLKEIKLQKSYAGEIRQRDYGTGFVVSLSILEGKIAEMQSVDAEPVRHGKWIWNENGIDWNIGAWVCSEC